MCLASSSSSSSSSVIIILYPDDFIPDDQCERQTNASFSVMWVTHSPKQTTSFSVSVCMSINLLFSLFHACARGHLAEDITAAQQHFFPPVYPLPSGSRFRFAAPQFPMHLATHCLPVIFSRRDALLVSRFLRTQDSVTGNRLFFSPSLSLQHPPTPITLGSGRALAETEA